MQIGRTTTRAERLAWLPGEAIALVRGPSPDEAATVALAMIDQLEAAKLSVDAVEMSIVFWSRALDGLDPGPAPADRLAKLHDDLAVMAATSPALAAWNTALRATVTTAHDLDWVIQFLLRAHQTWKMTVALRGRPPGA